MQGRTPQASRARYAIVKCPKCGYQYPAPQTQGKLCHCGTKMERLIVSANGFVPYGPQVTVGSW